MYILNIPNLLKAGEWQNYPPLAPWQRQMTKFWALVEFSYQIRKVPSIYYLSSFLGKGRPEKLQYLLIFSEAKKKNQLFENWLYTKSGFSALQARFSIKLIFKSWFLGRMLTYGAKHDLLPILTCRTCNSVTQKASATMRNLFFWWS